MSEHLWGLVVAVVCKCVWGGVGVGDEERTLVGVGVGGVPKISSSGTFDHVSWLLTNGGANSPDREEEKPTNNMTYEAR